MTHVADDAMLGKFVRRIKGLIERAMAGSLNLDKLWDIVQGYLDGKLENVEGVLRGTYAIRPTGFLPIDRTKSFDINDFLPEGWTIWRGSKDGDGAFGEEDQDQGSLALRKVNLTGLCLKTTLEGQETSVSRETNLKRLKKVGNIPLDAKVFQMLWEDQALIPEYWKKERNGKTTRIFFDGTSLRYVHAHISFVLFMYWHYDNWHWSLSASDVDRGVNDFSVVLEGDIAA